MKSIHVAIIAFLLVTLAVINQQIGKQEQLSQMRQAYSICWSAHNQASGQSETACGNAQDATHTEFICSTSNYCWLEVK